MPIGLSTAPQEKPLKQRWRRTAPFATADEATLPAQRDFTYDLPTQASLNSPQCANQRTTDSTGRGSTASAFDGIGSADKVELT